MRKQWLLVIIKKAEGSPDEASFTVKYESGLFPTPYSSTGGFIKNYVYLIDLLVEPAPTYSPLSSQLIIRKSHNQT